MKFPTDPPNEDRDDAGGADLATEVRRIRNVLEDIVTELACICNELSRQTDQHAPRKRTNTGPR